MATKLEKLRNRAERGKLGFWRWNVLRRRGKQDGKYCKIEAIKKYVSEFMETEMTDIEADITAEFQTKTKAELDEIQANIDKKCIDIDILKTTYERGNNDSPLTDRIGDIELEQRELVRRLSVSTNEAMSRRDFEYSIHESYSIIMRITKSKEAEIQTIETSLTELKNFVKNKKKTIDDFLTRRISDFNLMRQELKRYYSRASNCNNSGIRGNFPSLDIMMETCKIEKSEEFMISNAKDLKEKDDGYVSTIEGWIIARKGELKRDKDSAKSKLITCLGEIKAWPK